MDNVIELDRLSVHFQGTLLFNAFSLSASLGEKITITGPSGSGKLTLLRCIMGFTPASAGTIRILNEEITAASIWRLRGKMAYVAQEPELGEGVVRDALIRPFGYRINRALSYDEHESLRLFDCFLLPPSLIDKDITTLSGGEKQRVALVAALLLQRPVLLLDEVASALDSASKQAVRDYLCVHNDLTILSVSHDTREFALSDTIVDIGRIKQGVLT